MTVSEGRPSISAGRNPKKNQAESEMSIICSSGTVSREVIWDKLSGVQYTPEITKLEMVDLITAKEHYFVLRSVKNLFLEDGRQWENITFMDSFDSSEMLWWQAVKQELMQDYEASFESASRYRYCVHFKANVKVEKGTAKKSIIALFNRILKDRDVQHIGFGGAVEGTDNDAIPDALNGLFDEDSVLKEAVVLNVHCGWASSADPSFDNSWKSSLKSCIAKLRGAKQDVPSQTLTPKVEVRKTEDAIATIFANRRSQIRRTKSSSSGRSKMRHCTSMDGHNEEHQKISEFLCSRRKSRRSVTNKSTGLGDKQAGKTDDESIIGGLQRLELTSTNGATGRGNVSTRAA